MGATTRYGLRWPESTASSAIWTWIRNLAEDVEGRLATSEDRTAVSSLVATPPAGASILTKVGVTAASTDGNGEAFIPFPAPFPTACLAVIPVATVGGVSGVRLILRASDTAPYGVLANGFRVQGALPSDAIALHYIAYGY